jgi:hypothetical protein
MGDSPVAEAILDVFAACLQKFLAGLSPKKRRRVRRVKRFKIYPRTSKMDPQKSSF